MHSVEIQKKKHLKLIIKILVLAPLSLCVSVLCIKHFRFILYKYLNAVDIFAKYL